MVGDDAVAGLVAAFGLDPGGLDTGADQGAEQVGLVIVVRALQQRGDALQPHAGVDRRLGQRHPFAGKLLVLHEDEIPDLDEAVAILVRRAGRAAGNVVAMVIEDLRAWAARAGVAHCPEIVGGRDAQDAAFRQAGDLLPQVEGFVVLGIDGGEQALGRDLIDLGDQVPGELDGQRLEIIAEREVPQHLEEGVVAGGVADIVQVVVLAAGAHALLRGGGAAVGPLFHAGEDVLELHHAGIGEHQGRVVARHQGRRRHNGVAVLGEELEEGGPDLVDAAHVDNSQRDAARPRRPSVLAVTSSGGPTDCPEKRAYAADDRARLHARTADGSPRGAPEATRETRATLSRRGVDPAEGRPDEDRGRPRAATRKAGPGASDHFSGDAQRGRTSRRDRGRSCALVKSQAVTARCGKQNGAPQQRPRGSSIRGRCQPFHHRGTRLRGRPRTRRGRPRSSETSLLRPPPSPPRPPRRQGSARRSARHSGGSPPRCARRCRDGP